MTINFVARRRDVQHIIDDDPWDIVVHREGRTPDDAETTITLVGRVVPLGSWTTARGMGLNVPKGEIPPGSYGWLLLAPYDAAAMVTGDTVNASQRASSNTEVYRVGFSTRYAYKYEVILDERE